VFRTEEYDAVWRPEVVYTNKEVNLLTHEVNLEPRLMVLLNQSAVFRQGAPPFFLKCLVK